MITDKTQLINEVIQWAESDPENNACICILKQNGKMSTSIIAEDEIVICNLLANVMQDAPKFAYYCIKALIKIQEIQLLKQQNNENKHSTNN